MTKQPHNSEGYQHEALDRVHILSETLSEHVAEHPFILNNSYLVDLVGDALNALGTLYQAIGSADVAEWNPKDTPTRKANRDE